MDTALSHRYSCFIHGTGGPEDAAAPPGPSPSLSIGVESD